MHFDRLMELPELVAAGKAGSHRLLVDWLRSKHLEILNDPRVEQVVPKRAREFFSFMAEKHGNYSDKEWGRMKLFVYAFILALEPPLNALPNEFSIGSDYGPMIFTNLLLARRKVKQELIVPQLEKMFGETPMILRQAQQVEAFYARTQIFYYVMIPSLLQRDGTTRREMIMATAEEYFAAFGELDASRSHFDYFAFGGQLLRVMTAINPSQVIERVVGVWNDVFKSAWVCPSQFLLNFFAPWFCLADKANRKIHVEMPHEHADILAQLFERVASMRYHEFHTNFDWCKCIDFYDFVQDARSRERVMVLICSGLRTVDREEILTPSDSLKRFVQRRFKTYNEDPSPLTYIAGSMNVALRGITAEIKRFVGCSSVDSQGVTSVRRRRVSFAEQMKSDFEIDKHIYTVIKERSYKNYERAIRAFERFWSVCNKLTKRVTMIGTCYIRAIGSVMLKIFSNANPGRGKKNGKPGQTWLCHLCDFISSWIQLMIMFGYGQNVLATFAGHGIESDPHLPINLVHGVSHPDRLLSYLSINAFKWFVDIIVRFPPKLYCVFARIIAREMFAAFLKGRMTAQFTQYFEMLEREFNRARFDQGSHASGTVFNNVLCRMIEIAAEHLIMTESARPDDAEVLCSWVIFTIRLGSMRTRDRPNPMLGIYLRNYQKLIVGRILSPRKLVLQSCVLRTAFIYLRYTKMHSACPKQRNSGKQGENVRLDDFRESAKVDAMRVIMTAYTEGCADLNVSRLVPFLSAALKTDDEEMITLAAEICLNDLSDEIVQRLVAENESAAELFDAYFRSVTGSNVANSVEIMKKIPALAPHFLALPNQRTSVSCLFTVDDLGYNMNCVLKAISASADDKDSVCSLFIFISCCFEKVIRGPTRPKRAYAEIMRRLVVLLSYCWCHKFMRKRVLDFSSHLITVFGNMFLRGDSDVFFLSLLDVSGAGATANAGMLLELAKSFLVYAKERSVDIWIVQSTVDRLLSFFRPETRDFSMLAGLSLMVTFFPDCVRIDHLRGFLIQTGVVSAGDIQFPSVLNRLLKEFLDLQPQLVREEFVRMVYDIVCPLSIGIRTVLIKRVVKLKVKLPLESVEGISRGSNMVLWLQQIALAFLCGIQRPMLLSHHIKREILEVMKRRDAPLRVECLSWLIWIIIAIFRKRRLLDVFVSSEENVRKISHFLLNGLATTIPQVRSLAKKCLRTLKKSSAAMALFSKQIEEAGRPLGKLSKLFTYQPDIIRFYTRFAKMFPEYVPTTVVVNFITSVVDYSEKKDAEKFTYCTLFLSILKFLSVHQYVRIPIVSQNVLSRFRDSTYLQVYITVILRLWEHQEIPYSEITKKPVEKFLSLFPYETMGILMRIEGSVFCYDLIESLIVNDESMKFFGVLLEALETPGSNLRDPVCAFAVAERITVHERFCREKKLWNILNASMTRLVYEIEEIPGRRFVNLPMLSHCTVALINTMRFVIDVHRVLFTAQVFRFPFFNGSHVSKLFVSTCVRRTSDVFGRTLLAELIQSMPSVGPHVMATLFSRLIRKLPDSDVAHLWECVPQWIQFEKYGAAITRGVTELLRKIGGWVKSDRNELLAKGTALADVIWSLKSGIGNPDVDLCVSALKLSTMMAEMELLPVSVYHCILQQLFAYEKFSELPFGPYFKRFLSCRPDLLKDLPSDTIEMVITFMHEKIFVSHSVKKVFAVNSSIFFAAPSLLTNIPFSVVGAFMAHVERLHLADGEDISRMYDMMKYLMAYSQVVHMPCQEANLYARLGYTFLRLLMQRGEFENDFWNGFCTTLVRQEVTLFPEEVLELTLSVDNGGQFDLVCVATMIDSKIMFEKHRALIVAALKYLDSPVYDGRIHVTLMEPMLDAIHAEADGDELKRTVVYEFTELFKKYGPDNASRVFVLAASIMRVKASPHLEVMWEMYESMHSQGADTKELFKFLVRAVEFVPPEQQREYLELIHRKEFTHKDCLRVLAKFVPILLSSDRVSVGAKQYLLDNMAKLVISHSRCNFEKIRASLMKLRELHESLFSVDVYLVQLLILDAECATGPGRLRILESTVELLPVDRKERIIYLFEKMPLILWCDRFIPLMVALLAPVGREWWPLFALSNYLVDIGDELVTVTFAQLLDDSNVTAYKQLLLSLLKSGRKKDCRRVISGMLRMFHSTGTKLPIDLAQKAIGCTGDVQFLGFFLSQDSVPDERYLLPHHANDLIFGVCRPSMTAMQAAAVAMTFLNQYDTAHCCYVSCSRDSPLCNKMAKINDRFITYSEDESLLEPFRRCNIVSSKKSGVLKLLEDIIDVYKTGKRDDLEEAIAAVRTQSIRTATARKLSSRFEREVLVATEVLCARILGDPVHEPVMLESCLNHSFVRMIAVFDRFRRGDPPVRESDVDHNYPVILMTPLFRREFERVSGCTSRGLVAIGSDHINWYFDKTADLIKDNQMKESGWRKFAAFAFSVYCTRPSNDLFSVAFCAYCKIIMECLNPPQELIHEAAARVVTLCRYGIGSGIKAVKESVTAKKEIFRREMGDLWQFWLQQLVECARVQWFCDIVLGLFCDMSYRSSLYARKDNARSLGDVVNRAVEEHPSPQTGLMAVVQGFLYQLFNINFTEKSSQETLLAFVQETAKLNSVSDIDLLELRSRHPITLFDRALHGLSLAQLKLVGDFQAFATSVKHMSRAEMVSFVKHITGSSHSIDEIMGVISRATQAFNCHLPYIFPLRIDKPHQISFLKIQENFKVLSDNMIMIPMVSSMDKWRHLIIQRSVNNRGYNKSLLTLSSTFFLIRKILQRTYSAVCRNVWIFPSQAFDAGASLIISPVTDVPVTLESLFHDVAMMSSKEWLTESVKSRAEGEMRFAPFDRTVRIISRMVPYSDPMTMYVTEQGLADIAAWPRDALLRRMTRRLSQEDFLTTRAVCARSFGVAAVVRRVFNASYPNMQTYIAGIESGCVPMFQCDYDHGMITSQDESPFSAFRMSSNVITALGPSVTGDLTLTMAVFAEALTNNLESVRSWIEVLIGDEDFANTGIRPLEVMLQVRTFMENKIINFCPPQSPHDSVKMSEKWLTDIEKFLAISSKPSVAPMEAIPWF